MVRWCRKVFSRSCGAALLEFAIAFPILFGLFGLGVDTLILSYSLGAMQYVCNTVVNEGALYVEGWDDSDYLNWAQDRASELTQSLWLPAVSVSSQIVNRGSLGKWLSVALERDITLSPFSRLLFELSDSKFVVNAEAESRMESS